jgi:hypothetical protein
MFIAHKFSPLAALSAVMLSAALIVGPTTPAFAASAGYHLVPEATSTTTETVVVRDVLWKCAGGACTAKPATSRPEIVCASAARKIGKISAFTANGAPFAADQLEKCNAKAKKA